MSWTVLPATLKLHILQLLLASPSPIDHATHTDNLVCGVLETLISTNNTALVSLSLEAYYMTNTFVIKPQTTYTSVEETKTFRPHKKHAQQMKHLVDQTVPVSPPAGVTAPVDSGYASPDRDSVRGDSAPPVADLACALEAALLEGSAVKRGDRQRRLFDYVYHEDRSLESQKKTAVWKISRVHSK